MAQVSSVVRFERLDGKAWAQFDKTFGVSTVLWTGPGISSDISPEEAETRRAALTGLVEKGEWRVRVLA